MCIQFCGKLNKRAKRSYTQIYILKVHSCICMKTPLWVWAQQSMQRKFRGRAFRATFKAS